MLPKQAVKFIAMAVVLILAATAVFGQAPAGVLYSQPGVTVNGKPVSGEVGVFPGDKVQSGPASTELRLEGTLISLRPNSSLVLGKTVEFGCGAMDFFTFQQATLRVSGIEIKPVSTDATKLQIVHAGGTVTILMLLGAATLTVNGQSSTLATRESLSLAGDVSCPAMPGSPGQPTAAQSGHGKLIGVLIGAGAAGVELRAGRHALLFAVVLFQAAGAGDQVHPTVIVARRRSGDAPLS